MPAGRPTKYNAAIAELICERIASGELLSDICAEKGMPPRTCVYTWRRKHEEFAAAYTRARLEQQESWADELVRIAKDKSRDIQQDITEKVNPKTGEKTRIVKQKSDNTAAQRDRLICDQYWRIMQTVGASVFGAKQQHEVTGKDGAAFQPVLNITIQK